MSGCMGGASRRIRRGLNQSERRDRNVKETKMAAFIKIELEIARNIIAIKSESTSTNDVSFHVDQ